MDSSWLRLMLPAGSITLAIESIRLVGEQSVRMWSMTACSALVSSLLSSGTTLYVD
ncbi:MAG TPA: hypothetical protein VGD71_13490 [Kribbella sp.]|jgi:hypothetical protein